MNRYETVYTDDETGAGPSPEELKLAQLLAARSFIRSRTIRCEVCNTRRTVTGHGRYCSDLCRSRAYRARKKAAANRTAAVILADLRTALEARELPRAIRLADELSTKLTA